MPKAMQYTKGSVIYFEGDHDDRIFIMQQGSVLLTSTDIESGLPVAEQVKSGEFFGVKSAFGHFGREETATALVPTIAVTLTVQEFEHLFSNNKQLIMKMLRVFSNQLRQIHKKTESILNNIAEDQQTGMLAVAKCFTDDEAYRSACDIYIKFLKRYPNATNKEEVAKQFDKYDFMALPVVDKENRLVGIVTIDDAIDVLQDENTEDFELMAAMTPTEDSYFKTSVFKHAKNRILWLLLLMLSATVTGAILNYYEAAFAAVPILVSFIPMIMGTGGNCGSQSSTLIIRGMAMDEIRLKDFFRAVWKEIRVALLVGIALAICNGIRVVIQYHDLQLAIVLGLTLVGTVCLSKTLGCALPMLAKKLKLDPAIMAAPLITTIVDSCSILIYFTIAVSIMKI